MNRAIRHLLPLAILFISFIGTTSAQDFFERADEFFQQYTSDGNVDYAYLHANPEVLKPLLYDINHTGLNGRSTEYAQAFYINAYNLLVIHTIASKWPVDNPLHIPGMFDSIRHNVLMTPMTLDQIEHQKLMAKDADPRIHFALVCGARGCPPLLNEAYRPAILQDQLNKATTLAFQQPHILSVDDKNRTVTVTRIMEWYIDDFGGDESSVITFINRYVKSPVSKAYSLKFGNYDWSVNSY